jgi:hypothetical protein
LIEQAGFSVQVEAEGGLVARASPSTVLWLRSDPSRLPLLQPVITNVVALAVAQGAVPPERDRFTPGRAATRRTRRKPDSPTRQRHR